MQSSAPLLEDALSRRDDPVLVVDGAGAAVGEADDGAPLDRHGERELVPFRQVAADDAILLFHTCHPSKKKKRSGASN